MIFVVVDGDDYALVVAVVFVVFVASDIVLIINNTTIYNLLPWCHILVTSL